MKSVSSFGVEDNNYYRKMAKSPDFYTISQTDIFPHIVYQGPHYFAQKRELILNNDVIEHSSYKYENAIFHVQGHGFKGFEKITEIDSIRNRHETQIFDPFNFGLLKERDTQTYKEIYEHDVVVDPQTKIAQINLTEKETEDKLKGFTVTATYSNFDTYGYPQDEHIDYGDGISEVFSNVYVHNTNENGYLLGFLTDRTKTITRNNETWTTRDYISTHTKGKPTKIFRYSGGTTSSFQVSEETFHYNAKGNCTKHIVRPFTSPTSFTTEYEYDDFGRLTKETDPFGPETFYTTYQYHSTNGSLSKVTAHKNGKSWETVFGYDAFYRLTSATYPDGTASSTVYSWGAAGTNGLYCVQQTAIEKPLTKTYFDALKLYL